MQTKTWLSPAALLLLALGLAGCGSGGGTTVANPPVNTTPPPAAPAPTEPTGDVVIGLTDAPGDFLTYKVDVTGVTMTRADGVEVEALPLTTAVDFAQYTQLTEFLTTATVPAGVYTSIGLALDYTNAEIVLEDEAGGRAEAVALATDGTALTTFMVSVDLMGRETFRIAPGVPAHVTLDFDLEASNKVDLSVQPAAVTVDAVLLADTALEAPKSHRVRGLLRNVALDESTFALAIRPFFAPRGDFGRLTVHTTASTEFDIDATSFVGQEGLRALAGAGPGTPVIALGELRRDPRRFVASHVVAGSSLPWGESDIARGSVLARSDDVLTLRGATLVRANESVIFNADVAITIGPNTRISKQGSPGAALTTDAISVGQRITVVGTLTDPNFDSLALDATEGAVRMFFTDLNATVVRASPLVVDLQRINRQRIGLFDFAGTGNVEDANPEEYEVDTGSLPLAGLLTFDPVKIRGHVAPFGSAPSDFFANSFANVGERRGQLAISWLDEGDPAAVTMLDVSGIVFELNEATLGRAHHFVQAGVGVDLLNFGTTFTLSAPESARGAFTLVQAGTRQVFSDFGEYVAELTLRLDGSTAIKSTNARGIYSESTNSVVAHRIVMRLN